MKKVYQAEGSTDCRRACIASLIGCTIEEQPIYYHNKRWAQEMMDFLWARGYWWKHSIDPYNFFDNKWEGIDGLFMARVISPIGFKEVGVDTKKRHIILINRRGEVVHDPNPAYQGIEYPMASEVGYKGVLKVDIVERIK